MEFASYSACRPCLQRTCARYHISSYSEARFTCGCLIICRVHKSVTGDTHGLKWCEQHMVASRTLSNQLQSGLWTSALWFLRMRSCLSEIRAKANLTFDICRSNCSIRSVIIYLWRVNDTKLPRATQGGLRGHCEEHVRDFLQIIIHKVCFPVYVIVIRGPL